jgi:hypothetical protein
MKFSSPDLADVNGRRSCFSEQSSPSSKAAPAESDAPDRRFRHEAWVLTACLPQLDLQPIAEWAAASGFDALEVAAWRHTGARDFTASHIDAANLGPAEAERFWGLFDRHGLVLSSLAFYDLAPVWGPPAASAPSPPSRLGPSGCR